ncbi:MAG: choice-of-anchor L domain-containing protein [Candidatus Thermoplasmatota archaeon]|jgi:uncharacterized repeat protein (TIGR01451 family)|nr:choice-of-anchor L domain-containing protein [Candidatus Thermoplasmatota archaeon]
MRKAFNKKIWLITTTIILLSNLFIVYQTEKVSAGSYDGRDLALAILSNQSVLVSSSYSDKDLSDHRQGKVLSSLGIMAPTNGQTFALLSTGIAGAVPVTTNTVNPGEERGSWFAGGKYGSPRDQATLTMTLKVPPYMHYLYYDVQFFSVEVPEYKGSQYNDKFTATVNSPSKGITTYVIDINSGDFVLNSRDIPGTGFDVFATSGNPDGVDWVDTTPRTPGADGGATALITRENPVSPHEEIIVTFDIIDVGDNQFDSAVFIDNLVFSGFAKTELIARKIAQDVNGGYLECGDTIRYTITISNIGTANQGDNPGNEFEDDIPINTTYVPGSATATSGTISYSNGKIIWNGGIPAQSSVALTFNVTVNQSLINGTIISNQGTIYWDSNEDGTNDATELTDDPAVDDGIDQDGDGETGDDDPTRVIVFAFEPPSVVTEDFSDDTPSGKASQSYYGRLWFETDKGKTGSVFEVAPSYHYSTAKSFKTKIRSSGGKRYWNYTLSQLNSDMIWWEAWFACGNTSEVSDMYLDFKNTAGDNIARIKFEYVHEGTSKPTDWVLKLYYMDPSSGWISLDSDFQGGYLYNGWYKIRIEKNGENNIKYYLYRSGVGLVRSKTAGRLSAPFSNFARVEWYNTKNPVVCPMFFWDEHRVGLIS